MPCLWTHRPLDAVIVALGTNDLKMRFSVSPGDIAGGVGTLLKIVRQSECGPEGGAPKMLVVCPAPILSEHGERPDFVDMFAGGYEKSLRLAPAYEAVAREHGAAFLNAGDIVKTSAFDGIHLDLDAHEALGRAVAKAVAETRLLMASLPRCRLACITVLVRDYDEAKEYYTGVLGFEAIEDTPLGNGKRWVLVAPPSGGMALLLARATTPQQEARIGDQTGGRVFLFLQTDDFWRHHRLLAARGVKFVEEPREEPYGTVAVFEDLYGNRWDLIRPATT